MAHLNAPNGGRRRLHVAQMTVRTHSSSRRVGLDLREAGRVDVLDLGRDHVDARRQREHVLGVVKLAWARSGQGKKIYMKRNFKDSMVES